MEKDFNLDALALQLSVSEHDGLMWDFANRELTGTEAELFDEMGRAISGYSGFRIRLGIFSMDLLQRMAKHIRSVYHDITGEDEYLTHISTITLLESFKKDDLREHPMGNEAVFSAAEDTLEKSTSGTLALDSSSLYCGNGEESGNRFSIAVFRTHTMSGTFSHIVASLGYFDKNDPDATGTPAAVFQANFPETVRRDMLIPPASLSSSNREYANLLMEILDLLLTGKDFRKTFEASGNELLPFLPEGETFDDQKSQE